MSPQPRHGRTGQANSLVAGWVAAEDYGGLVGVEVDPASMRLPPGAPVPADNRVWVQGRLAEGYGALPAGSPVIFPQSWLVGGATSAGIALRDARVPVQIGQHDLDRANVGLRHVDLTCARSDGSAQVTVRIDRGRMKDLQDQVRVNAGQQVDGFFAIRRVRRESPVGAAPDQAQPARRRLIGRSPHGRGAEARPGHAERSR